MLAALTLQLLLAQAAPEAAVTPAPPPPQVRLLSTASVVGLASFGELIVGGAFVGLAWLIGGDSPGYLVVAGLALAPAGAWALPYAFGGDSLEGLGWSYLGGAAGGIVAGTLGYLVGANDKSSTHLDAFVFAGLFGLIGQLAGSPTALGLAHYFKNPPQVAVTPVHGGGVFSVAMRF
jgi:hypothetical protein